MADEKIQTTPDPVPPIPSPASTGPGAGKPDPIPHAPAQSVSGPGRTSGQPTLGRTILGWILFLGLMVILGFVASLVLNRFTSVRSPWVGYLVAIGLFVLLDQGGWLSQLLGIRLGFRSPSSRVGGPGGKAGSTVAEPASAGAQAAAPEPRPSDPWREVVETVVFVVVLVLLLKTFVAEAFVIPTGSMAITLWGYQKNVTCPECKYDFPVNSSDEVDPQQGPPTRVTGCLCPNCRLSIDFSAEVIGRLVRRTDNELVLEDRDGRQTFVVLVDRDAPVLLNDQKSKLDDLKAGTPLRLLCKLESYHTKAAVAVEASTSGEFPNKFQPINPDWRTGDRVLVVKYLYDMQKPQRHDVVVFKYPESPQRNHIPLNYIKRLLGLSGETIAVHYGKIYAAEGLSYEGRPLPLDEKGKLIPEELREKKYMYKNDPEVVAQFKKDVVSPLDHNGKKFHIVRKAPDKILSLLRPVFDNDFQNPKRPIRWSAEKPALWVLDNPAAPRRFEHTAAPESQTAWLRYQHIPEAGGKRELISDLMGYNTGRSHPLTLNWVGDLILEFDVKLDSAQKDDALTLELSKGVDRFQARFDLATGQCTLVRLTIDEKGQTREKELASKPTSLKSPGSYHVRLANVDERLTLWVNSELPFGDGWAYDPPHKYGPTEENDLQPASIGVRAAGLSLSHLKIGRDTYYTAVDDLDRMQGWPLTDTIWSDPTRWHELRGQEPQTYYVQPGHYLCLGDNSPASSDGRYWGLVPDRLLLGRALMVYYPFWPFSNPNRAGPIR